MHHPPTPAETLGLYLSIPFCRSKCTFCNFASNVYPATQLPLYLARLTQDLTSAHHTTNQANLILPTQIDTIYLGGGTPSILSPTQLSDILSTIRQHFPLTPNPEITLEAAPSFLPNDLLATAAEQGVTRISFGVQTFTDTEARATGRLHTAAQARHDIARARHAGLTVSVDLIAGLPGQTEASWQHSLATLAEAAPEHASIYMLEVDEDSTLGGEMLLGGTRYGASLTPSDDAVADFYSQACEALTAQGLPQYEISNFARPGHESRHNQRYWQRQPYLGLGLDAHSMLRSISDHAGQPGQAVRFSTTDDLPTYLQAPHQPTRHRLTPQEELEEAWFLGLRRNAGVSLPALRAEFGPSALEPFHPILHQLAQDGLLTLTPDRAALTHKGRLLSNDVFTSFLDVTQTCPESAEIPSLAPSAR